MLLVHYLSWTLLHEHFSTTPGLEVGYWLGQLGLLATAVWGGVMGFRPALTVTCEAETLRLKQGPQALSVPMDAVTSVEKITAQRYHRHERRYAATQVFIGLLGDTALLVRRTSGGPIVIALPPDAQAALYEQMTATLAHAVSHERAAA